MVHQPTLVSIIIVNYNGGNVILECLHSLETCLQAVPYEVIVVDNASHDGSPAAIKAKFPKIPVLEQLQNAGFGAANNLGAKRATGEFLWLLNSDTCLTSDILPHLIALMQSHPQVGIIGPKLINPDGSFQLSVSKAISILGEFKTLQQVKQYNTQSGHLKLAEAYAFSQEVDIVIGAAFLIRKALFEQVGGFDENFFMYFEESDLCQRVRNLGYKVLYRPEVSLIHIGGYSVGKLSERMSFEYRRSQLYYYRKHRPLWEQIVLRLYLLIKFSAAAIRSLDRSYLPFLTLLMNFRDYPLGVQNMTQA